MKRIRTAPTSAPVVVAFNRCTDDGSLVSKQGYRLAYGGVPGCWRVKPEDFPAEALAQQPAAVDGAMELLREIRDLLWSLPKDCMGSDTDASGQPYPIRDEVIDNITKQLAAQPGGAA